MALKDESRVPSSTMQSRRRFLVTAAEIFREELLRACKHRHVVYRTRKAVSFIRRHDVLDRESAVAQRTQHLEPGLAGEAHVENHQIVGVGRRATLALFAAPALAQDRFP